MSNIQKDKNGICKIHYWGTTIRGNPCEDCGTEVTSKPRLRHRHRGNEVNVNENWLDLIVYTMLLPFIFLGGAIMYLIDKIDECN